MLHLSIDARLRQRSRDALGRLTIRVSVSGRQVRTKRIETNTSASLQICSLSSTLQLCDREDKTSGSSAPDFRCSLFICGSARSQLGSRDWSVILNPDYQHVTACRPQLRQLSASRNNPSSLERPPPHVLLASTGSTTSVAKDGLPFLSLSDVDHAFHAIRSSPSTRVDAK